MLTFPTAIVDMLFSIDGSIKFCFMHFGVILLVTYKLNIILFLGELIVTIFLLLLF